MSRIYNDLKIGLDEELEEKLEWLSPSYGDYRILRQSIDARRRHSPQFIYSVEVFDQGEDARRPPIQLERVRGFQGEPIVIIGAGPAGLFAALRLCERGVPCILLEQGAPTEKRVGAIARFWRYGELDPKSNVGFGEGGAGLFSDGKLITRIKSPHIPYVLQRMVEFGAPAEIEYLANPHVGSDRIRRMIPRLRARLIELGCDVRFGCTVESLLFSGRHVSGVRLEGGAEIRAARVILACGHSAEDLFHRLVEDGVFMEGKSFAVGLRIEHPQEVINRIQYREFYDHPKLGAANYRLAEHDSASGVGVYSFCMCPGGFVLSCATAPGQIVSNGMSNYHRNSKFANAAMVVSIDHAKHFGDDLFGGLKFRAELESRAFEMVRAQGGTRELPALPLMDFLNRRTGEVLPSSSPSQVVAAPIYDLFSSEVLKSFTAALTAFDRRMKGFVSEQAQLHGVESRTSCPIRITRDDESLQSLSHEGLYPTGEGAGYAGGITSAACDGIRVADRICHEITGHTLPTEPLP